MRVRPPVRDALARIVSYSIGLSSIKENTQKSRQQHTLYFHVESQVSVFKIYLCFSFVYRAPATGAMPGALEAAAEAAAAIEQQSRNECVALTITTSDVRASVTIVGDGMISVSIGGAMTSSSQG